jgi:DNA-binding MarR family transcriptional regulator
MPPLLNAPGPRYEALLQLLRTAEALWESSRAFFSRWDLSPSQFNVLNLLHGLPAGLTQTELSRELIMHRSNVTGLVDRLEKRGLAERKSVPGDRRAHRVVTTRKGAALMRKILPHYWSAAEAALGHLPVKGTKQLLTDLGRISSNANLIAGKQSAQP